MLRRAEVPATSEVILHLGAWRVHRLRQKGESCFGVAMVPCERSWIRIEQGHVKDGGELEDDTDFATGVALLDPPKHVAGNAGPFRKLPGWDLPFNASGAQQRPEQEQGLPGIAGIGSLC